MRSFEKSSVKMTQAVVDVEFCVAKGEVEMKSWNVDVKRAERARTRIGAFSVLALMILFLSTGNLLADDSFKLWQLGGIDDKPVALKHLADEETGNDATAAKATKWLTTEPTQENFDKFLSTFSTPENPFRLIEGFKAAYLKSFEDGKNEDFKKNVTEMLAKADEKDFGKTFDASLRAKAFKQILETLMDKSKSDLEKEGLLKSLFDRRMLLALGLTDADPNKAVETPKPVVDDATKKAIEDMKAQAETDRKANQEQMNAIQAAMAKAFPQPAAASAVPALPKGGTGELDESKTDFQAKQICDKWNAIIKANQDAFNKINSLFNGLEELRRQPDYSTAKKENKNQLEDILPGIIQESLKKDNQVAQAPTPQVQPQRQARNDQNNNERSNPLSPVPESRSRLRVLRIRLRRIRARLSL